MILTTTLSHIASIPGLCGQGHRAVALQVGRCENVDEPLRLSNPGIKYYNLTLKDKLWLVLHTQDRTPEYEVNVRQLRAWIADTAMDNAGTAGMRLACTQHDVYTAEHRLAVVDGMMQLKDGTVGRSLAEAYYWATLLVPLRTSAVDATWNAALALTDDVLAEYDLHPKMDEKLIQLFDTEDTDNPDEVTL